MQNVTSQCLGKQIQLETMLRVCEQLGVEITLGYPTSRYFTAACREEWDDDGIHIPACKIQAKIEALAARLPNVVCFSMDCYCTLIYVI